MEFDDSIQITVKFADKGLGLQYGAASNEAEFVRVCVKMSL